MKNLVFVFALVMLSSAGFSQKVDLSGKWKLNETKSELGDQFSLAPKTMVLDHSKKTIDIEKNGEFNYESYTTNDFYTLDGKECENPGWGDRVKTSTAVWDKSTKVLKISTKVPMDNGSDAEINEEFSLNGENLIIVSTAASDYGEMTEKFVFDKQ